MTTGAARLIREIEAAQAAGVPLPPATVEDVLALLRAAAQQDEERAAAPPHRHSLSISYEIQLCSCGAQRRVTWGRENNFESWVTVDEKKEPR